MKKKLLALLLALALVLALCACGAPTEEETAPEATPAETTGEPETRGLLALSNMTEEEYNAIKPQATELDYTYIYFDDMNSMLLALQSGKIDRVRGLPLSVGQYIAARNENIVVNESAKTPATMQYSMGVKQENTELYNLLNSTLEALIADGTIDELVATYIDGCLASGEEPAPVELPYFEGANTIKVAVSGDLPPFDFVSADGVPAGFNVAVLAAIAEAAQINIEPVQMNTGARMTALSSNTVDVVFWFSEEMYMDFDPGEEFSTSDTPEDVILTVPYYEAAKCYLTIAE